MADALRTRSSLWVSRAVLVVTGLVLISAALLKGYQLSTQVYEQPSSLLPRTGVTVLVVAEIALGVWLSVGMFPVTARALAVICFATFLVVALGQVAIGRASCGCFGFLSVTPWLTAATDLAILIGVLWVRPPPIPAAQGPRCVVLIAAVLSAVAWGGWVANLEAPPPLTVTPEVLQLGEVSQGQVIETEILLTNQSQQPQTVERFDPSCTCLSAAPASVAIEPMQSARVRLNLDLSKEPHFSGRLSIRVKVVGHGELTFSEFTVAVNVRRAGP